MRCWHVFFCKKKSRASQMKAKCEMYDWYCFYILFYVWHLLDIAVATVVVVVFGVYCVFGVNERIFHCVYVCIGYLIDDR